ncbi:hypothetical protein V3Q77_08330 [Flavobacterium davisii]|uniref:Uncharacterized protein n=1 Tax=Flavobacterium davisii TaxID=2906077 RepID=A0ABW8PPP0_9FLAO
MKKGFYYLLLVFFASLGNAQEYPGDAIELLVGKQLKILPSESDYIKKEGYSNFHKSTDFSFNTSVKAKYNDYVNKVFTLKSVTPIKKRGNLGKTFALELVDGKKTYYYSYETWTKMFWIFEVVGGFEYPVNYWCKDIEKREDKFTSKTSYISPTEKHVYFLEEDGQVYISLKAHGNIPKVGAKGVIILLEDGKIEKPNADITVSYNHSYDYTAFIKLTKEDILLLQSKKITAYRLYIFDFELENGDLYKEYLKCLIKV